MGPRLRLTIGEEAKVMTEPTMRSRIDGWALLSSNFKFEVSNFKFRISNLKFEILNLKSSISHFTLSVLPLCLCAALASLVSACGYHVGGTASLLPPGLKVIAVPALKNDTPRYRIEQRMTEAVIHEFIARTKYRIVSSEDSADAVLHGEITSFEAIPAVFDTTPATTPNSTTVPPVNTTTARATTMLVSVHIKVRLEERETKKELYQNDDYLFRQPYEISTDPAKFFDEQGPALERMSRDFAARLVSDVLENF
jgi:hypothetical protein